jgi:hypothetical protein
LLIGLAFGYLPEKRGSFVAHPIAHGAIIPVPVLCAGGVGRTSTRGPRPHYRSMR